MSAADAHGEGGSRADLVHNRVAMLRAERRVSRRELAQAIGVHYQTVGYLERGEFNPSLHLALRIARFFEVPVEFVFSLDEFPRIGPDAG
ncbi:helix-turn-helix transcriptional regulator [Agromyces seonyuensis]|uniref:Helix-turn-helix domain-containing protein n=1 Tax=Agromyces seonyuensis TaxID=2662446 RepID=A0A6I4P5Y4_9MICO|nr:helix-turn-helix transcriptional regulator [Agromyces seonyuensis]MWB99899.1 helix-turn-helix domain-containing protein [Agromyces seonyuensis]